MRLYFIAGVIWAITGIANPVAVVPTYSTEVQDGITTSVNPTIQTFLIPYETEVPSEGIVDVRSMPHYAYFSPADEPESAFPNDEGFGERIKTKVEQKANYPDFLNASTRETDKPEDNPYDSIQFMELEKTLRSANPDYNVDENAGQLPVINVSTLTDAKNVSEQMENSTQLPEDYQQGPLDISVLSQILRTFDEMESISRNKSANEAGVAKEELQSNESENIAVLPSGTFAKPIVVPDEHYNANFGGNHAQRSLEVIFENNSGFNEQISTAETIDRKSVTSSSSVLSPLQVGIALVNARNNHTVDDESNEIDRVVDTGTSIKENSEVGFLADQAKHKIVEPAKSSVEIQKSVELYHHAPIQEIHYPVEYTSQIVSQTYDDDSRNNGIQNEAEAAKTVDDHQIIPSQSLSLEDQNSDIQISLNSGMSEESEANIVAQRTVYVPTINDHQVRITALDYGDRKYLPRVPAGSGHVPNEEPVQNPSELAVINHVEKPLLRNPARLAVYQLANLQLLPNKPAPVKAEENRNVLKQYVQPYIVEYEKSVEQAFQYQPTNDHPNVYVPVKFKSSDETPRAVPQAQVPQNIPPFQRLPKENVDPKTVLVPHRGVEKEPSYPSTQNVIRQEIIPQAYSIPFRPLPTPQSNQKQILFPPVVPYSLHRFAAQPQAFPMRLLQPYILKQFEFGPPNDQLVPRYKSRPPHQPTDGERYNPSVNVFYNHVAKAPEENSYHILQISPRPVPISEQRQNFSVLQFSENRPAFAMGKDKTSAKRDHLKKKMPEAQISAELEPPRKFGTRLRFFVQPQPYTAMVFDSSSRKRQAVHSNLNRSAKEIKEQSAYRPEGRNSIAVGNFRQSKMEYGFKPPMVPSVQYDEETATRVEN